MYKVIVQAGGKGTRLLPLTKNRPKCLTPVLGTTILGNLVQVFGEENLIIIGDHLFDVLENYCTTFFSKVKLVKAYKKGTCGGLEESLELIPPESPFLFMWSDLFLTKKPKILKLNKSFIGLSRTFDCRYQYNQEAVDHYIKETSNKSGIAGFFFFPEKESVIRVINENKSHNSFVGGVLSSANYKFDDIFWLDQTSEIGTMSALKNFEDNRNKCRFFNSVDILEDTVVKRCVDDQYSDLIENEVNWYKCVEELNVFSEIPKVINKEPFEISKAKGEHIYDLKTEQKIEALCYIGIFLNKMHSFKVQEPDISDIKEMYVNKTLNRYLPYRNLIRDSYKDEILINDKLVKNKLKNSEEYINRLFDEIKVDKFTLIHGDVTCSNMLWEPSTKKISLFDPRGVFGNTKLVGDPAYDWAKLYYSIVDNYDLTNIQNITIQKTRSGWNIFESNVELEKYFWQACPFDKKQILIRVGLIWFSLIGYAKNDIEVMNLAFLKGNLILEGVNEL